MTLVKQVQLDIDFPDVNIRRENIRYVDPVNGNNLDATFGYATNNFRTPYAAYNSASAAANSGDTVVLLPGTYSATMTLKDGVNVYVSPGAIITGGFRATSQVTCRIYGHAVFQGVSSVPALNTIPSASGSNITFEFDTISGTRQYGILHESGDGILRVNGNSIFCGNPLRIQNGTLDAIINIRDYMKSYDGQGIIFGKDLSAPYPSLIGTIIVNCPVIESTSNSAYRTCILFSTTLSDGPSSNDYKIIINTKEIRQNSSPIVESYPNIISSCIWIDGGDNIHIHGDLIGNACHCISSRSAGSNYHTGTFYFYGNMESNIEVISSNAKVLNGNGWHSISVNNGMIKTLGNGATGGLVETANYYIGVHGGTPGNMYFNNCTLYNAATDSDIFVLNQPSNICSVNVNNCLMYTEGSGGNAATSVQADKKVNYNNVLSNKGNDTMISSNLTTGSSLVVDNGLVIPK